MAHKRHLAEKEGIRLSFSPETPRWATVFSCKGTVLTKPGSPRERRGQRRDLPPTGRGEQLELTEVEGGWGVYSAEFLPQEGGPIEITISAPKHDRELKTKLTVRCTSAKNWAAR
ncbi:MAG: hypothetical protein CM1200mP29_13190 [Verrucomicrobiota bacterium]|nr:MAG: hypothetical protein CM1200mP29_13190 [Verrucomicrobiota bacterium]